MQPGDLIFCRSRGAISRAIRIAEWLRGHRGQWNHVAIITAVEDGRVEIVQAVGGGVTRDWFDSPKAIAPGGVVELVTPECDQLQMVRFARAEVHRKYGFLTIASICVSIIAPWFLTIRLPDTWICSALVAESLRFGGWLHDWPDIYQVTPQQLYDATKPPAKG